MSRGSGTEDRRAVILDAAVRVLARHGLAETTTRKIASEAHVNQAMIGYYFGGKDELLYAVLQEMMRRTGELIGATAPTDRGFAEAVTVAIKAFWANVEQAPELQVLQYELTLYALRRPESAWLARRQYEGYCGIVARVFEAVCSATDTTPSLAVDAIARFIVGGLDGMILQFISTRDADRAHQDLQHLIAATLMLALGPRDNDATPAAAE